MLNRKSQRHIPIKELSQLVIYFLIELRQEREDGSVFLLQLHQIVLGLFRHRHRAFGAMRGIVAPLTQHI